MRTKKGVPAAWRHLWAGLRFPLISVIIGLLVGALIIYLSGQNGWQGVLGLLTGGFGSLHALTTTLNRATPIVFAGLSSALAWGCGYPSMGISGQMVLGAFVASVTAVSLPLPPFLMVPACILLAMAAGSAYGFLASFISAKFETSLLIITLMMNYLADNLASYLTTYVFLDPKAVDRLAVQTQKITGSILPRLFKGYTVHWGFVLAILFTVLITFIVRRTSFGYRGRMNGLNPRFAQYGGVNSMRTMFLMMALSGAMAGMGGAAEALGTRFRYIDGMITSPGYAWSGITAALMSANHPAGVFFSALFLAGLTTGGAAIELAMNTSAEITQIIQGVIVMLITARIVLPRLPGVFRRPPHAKEVHHEHQP